VIRHCGDGKEPKNICAKASGHDAPAPWRKQSNSPKAEERNASRAPSGAWLRERMRAARKKPARGRFSKTQNGKPALEAGLAPSVLIQ
jgi:hypothetical protein